MIAGKKQDEPKDLAEKKALVIKRVFERICQRDHEGWLTMDAVATLHQVSPRIAKSELLAGFTIFFWL